MNIIKKLPGPLLVFMGACSLSFGGLIVKSFEGATLWQILFWRTVFFLLIISKKNTVLQNNICHKVAPSNDLTIKPPKLRLQAPIKTNKGPGSFLIIFIKYFRVFIDFFCVTHK